MSWHPFLEPILCTGDFGGHLACWDVDTSAPPCVSKLHDAAIKDLAWHPGGHLFCTASADKTLKFWSRNRPGTTMKDRYQLGEDEDSAITSAAADSFSPLTASSLFSPRVAAHPQLARRATASSSARRKWAACAMTSTKSPMTGSTGRSVTSRPPTLASSPRHLRARRPRQACSSQRRPQPQLQRRQRPLDGLPLLSEARPLAATRARVIPRQNRAPRARLARRRSDRLTCALRCAQLRLPTL